MSGLDVKNAIGWAGGAQVIGGASAGELAATAAELWNRDARAYINRNDAIAYLPTVPSTVHRALVIENGELVVRGRDFSANDPLFETGFRWGVAYRAASIEGLNAKAAQEDVDALNDLITSGDDFQANALAVFADGGRRVFGKVSQSGGWDILLSRLAREDGLSVETYTRNGSGGLISVDGSGQITYDPSAPMERLEMRSGAVIESYDRNGDPMLLVTDANGRVLNDAEAVAPTVDALPVYAFGEETLRQLRYRLTGRKRGANIQCNIAAIGDSYTQSATRWSGPVAEMLIAEYGDGGGGWTGYGYFGAYSGPYVANGAQPLGRNGNARPNLYPLTFVGAWQRSYNNSVSPDLSHVTSATPGDQIRVGVPAAPDHTGLRLIWVASADGIVRHRVDGGSWTELPVQGSVGSIQSAVIPLTAGAHSVEIEVVSGTVNLCGHDALSSAPGVRFHKLGGSGSRIDQWASRNAAQQQAGWALLAIDAAVLMDGTNSQTVATPPGVWRGHMETIITRLRAALNQPDIAIVIPPENQRTDNPVAMRDYAAAGLDLALDLGAAFRDLQPDFGRVPADYAAGSSLPLFNADGLHPEPATGGVVMTGALFQFLNPL
ncbi:hypothetical protein QCN27_03945 [Cereibacter sp. SYSU M97828]|nr:hypothetical protein [Cereibacter flavus]